ncbi:hypothetical protein BWI96_16880 [Siphonobacter sp. SORGH_AS_0500]|uniref:glycoside hydrolase family 127 protein n=1 Tax=Siphonobacter sp. SORGH_AS_0500 TaxID=1864824 RepID=UPI000CBA4448|nr:beta-L-arabinofuranosidase domain-containing protein [Siphonobacter sp. SORGH_AS_0500]PKK35390.1 hypothetical protein BWI96_16880 [Siphonobacter sp. SORGH_AS_0500]
MLRLIRQASLLIGCLGWLPATAQSSVPDELTPIYTEKITGYIGEKLDASYQNRILAQDVDRLVSPFRDRTETRCWQSEFWGKWFTSAVLAYRYKPEPTLKAKLDKAVQGLIATQTPDGYIGNYSEASQLEQWDIWGRKYCMLGLLAYYDLTQDAKSLTAARRLADHLIQQLKEKNVLLVRKGNHRGMATSSVLEPITLLYTRTKEPKYLQFAEEIVRQWESADGPQLIARAGVPVSERFPKPQNWFGWEQGQKAYEMMSCYEGLLELYRVTGKASYREAVEKTWQNIHDTEINLAGSGSAVECWFGGKKYQTMAIHHYQETCVTATWIKLNQQLLRLTGEAKYADAIEQTYYNALLGSMKPDGSDWAKYTPLMGQRLEGSEQCGMGLNCCVASGPRGLFTLPSTVVMQSQQGVQLNFFVPGSYTFKSPKGQVVTVKCQTRYPVSGDIHWKIEIPQAEDFAVDVRIPEWADSYQLLVKSQEVSGKKGTYKRLKQSWKSGDEITLNLYLQGKVIQMGIEPQQVAIVRGPILLARDARLPGPVIDATLSPMMDKTGTLKLDLVKENTDGIWMQFQGSFMPESYKEGPGNPVSVILCDYASAGNTNDARSRFRVWLPQLLNPQKL